MKIALNQYRFLRHGICGMGILGILLFYGCTISTPFSGPKYKQEPGADEKVIVGLTKAVTGDDRKKNKVFWAYTRRVEKSLQDREGFIGYSMRKQLFGKEAWTMTVWDNETSLDAFVRSDLHQEAMKEGWPALVSASFARIEIDRDEIPISWERAEELLNEYGRDYDEFTGSY